VASEPLLVGAPLAVGVAALLAGAAGVCWAQRLGRGAGRRGPAVGHIYDVNVVAVRAGCQCPDCVGKTFEEGTGCTCIAKTLYAAAKAPPGAAPPPPAAAAAAGEAAPAVLPAALLGGGAGATCVIAQRRVEWICRQGVLCSDDRTGAWHARRLALLHDIKGTAGVTALAQRPAVTDRQRSRRRNIVLWESIPF
jgi:hypothetical protein